jgi:hypothetical protein
MNFAVSEELTALLDSLETVLERAGLEPNLGERPQFDALMDGAVEESGLLDAAGMEEFGPLAGALIVERIARVPKVMELGASALIRPLFCPDWPRPVAVLAANEREYSRFLPQSETVIFVGEDDALAYRMERGDAEEGAGFFAYPMGRLVDPAGCRQRASPIGPASEVRRLMSIATASEIAGALQGGLEAVTDYVRNRRQFGRTLGTFQVVRHRLATGATEITAMRLLAMKAAQSGDMADSQIALGYAQERAARIVGDLHQFMGATGLTLDHPLYIWTYRVKLLLSDLGGSHGQFLGLSDSLWSANQVVGRTRLTDEPSQATSGG